MIFKNLMDLMDWTSCDQNLYNWLIMPVIDFQCIWSIPDFPILCMIQDTGSVIPAIMSGSVLTWPNTLSRLDQVSTINFTKWL